MATRAKSNVKTSLRQASEGMIQRKKYNEEHQELLLGKNPWDAIRRTIQITQSLQHRREYLSLVECYKTVFGLNGLDLNDYFECCRSKSIRANHSFKIQTKSARINAFKYSFFVRIIKEWNNLPNHLFGHDINDINANRFKSSLKKWMNIHWLYATLPNIIDITDILRNIYFDYLRNRYFKILNFRL